MGTTSVPQETQVMLKQIKKYLNNKYGYFDEQKLGNMLITSRYTPTLGSIDLGNDGLFMVNFKLLPVGYCFYRTLNFVV